MKLPNVKPSPSEITTDAAATVVNGTRTMTVFVNETETVSPFTTIYKSEDDLVHKIEKVIRNSFEYRQYVTICRTEFDLTKCKFIPDVDLVDGSVSLELHHYPFTLFDITKGVLRDRYGILDDRNPVYSEPVNLFSIAERVMKLHYLGVVGLVPLSLTAHELAHGGDIFIPLTEEYVFGSWKELLDKPGEYDIDLDDQVIFNVRRAIEMTDEMLAEGTSVDLSVLEPIKTKVVHESFSDEPNYIVNPTDNQSLA